MGFLDFMLKVFGLIKLSPEAFRRVRRIWNAIAEAISDDPAKLHNAPYHETSDTIRNSLAEANEAYYHNIVYSMSQYRIALLLDPNCAIAAEHLGHLYTRQGRYSEALNCYQLYRDIAVRTKSTVDTGNAERFLGISKRITGDIKGATQHFDTALCHYNAIGYTLGKVATYDEQGVLYRICGRLSDAKSKYLSNLGILETLDESDRDVKIRLAKTLSRFATVERLSMNFNSAMEKYQKSKLIAEDCGLERQIAEDLLHLGMCKIALTNEVQNRSVRALLFLFDEAENLFEEALSRARKISARETEAKALLNFAVLRRKEGDFVGAERSLWSCLRRNKDLSSSEGIAAVFYEMSLISCLMSDFEAAEQQIIRAIVECELNGIIGEKGKALAHLGNVYTLSGQCDAAKKVWTEGAQDFDNVGQFSESGKLRNLIDLGQC
ncbi:MAG: tetratricopeptide repeat protein [Candidatus Thiodiazotropha sp.]